MISLPETVRVRGMQIDPGLHKTEGGKVVLVTCTLNKDTMLEKDTQLGLFQICKHPIKIVNDVQEESEGTETVCSVREDLDLGWKFRSHLKHGRLDLEQDLASLLLKHKEAIALPGVGGGLRKTEVIKHQIKLKPGTQPIYIPAYKIPHPRLAIVNKLIKEMLSQDVIESSNSEWNFPVILVPVSDGTVLPTIDYRALNQQTIPDRLPLPVISDRLRSLGTENTLFSTIDIKSTFWQTELQEESKDFIAFSIPAGHYRLHRMPFGLCNSPLTYMR